MNPTDRYSLEFPQKSIKGCEKILKRGPNCHEVTKMCGRGRNKENKESGMEMRRRQVSEKKKGRRREIKKDEVRPG